MYGSVASYHLCQMGMLAAVLLSPILTCDALGCYCCLHSLLLLPDLGDNPFGAWVVEIFSQIVFIVEIDPEFALSGLRVVLD